jgi:hypothetical protein
MKNGPLTGGGKSVAFRVLSAGGMGQCEQPGQLHDHIPNHLLCGGAPQQTL